MADFLEALNQLIVDSDLSIVELVGALEVTKAELIAEMLDDEGESID
jgi:hypothetical protein